MRFNFLSRQNVTRKETGRQTLKILQYLLQIFKVYPTIFGRYELTVT